MSAHRTYRTPVPIRFADIDALGHVNNAVFLTYMEVARTAFWAERIGPVRVQEIDLDGRPALLPLLLLALAVPGWCPIG